MHQERCARKVAWDLVKHIYKLKNADKTTLCTPIDAKVMPAPTPTRPKEREFVVDSGASMHMMSKKELSPEEMDSKKVQDSHCGIDCQWEKHTHEEAQVFVHDLNLFVAVQLFQETPAILLLGQLCEDHGYSCEWVSGQKPRLTNMGRVTSGRRTTSYLLSFQGYQLILKAFRLLHRHQRTR